MANAQIYELRERAASLNAALVADPDRPHWQAELTAILLDLADIISLLSSDYISCAGDLSGVLEVLVSLENRHSDLRCRMSERA